MKQTTNHTHRQTHTHRKRNSNTYDKISNKMQLPYQKIQETGSTYSKRNQHRPKSKRKRKPKTNRNI